jgi:hypothetical protein
MNLFTELFIIGLAKLTGHKSETNETDLAFAEQERKNTIRDARERQKWDRDQELRKDAVNQIAPKFTALTQRLSAKLREIEKAEDQGGETIELIKQLNQLEKTMKVAKRRIVMESDAHFGKSITNKAMLDLGLSGTAIRLETERQQLLH